MNENDKILINAYLDDELSSEEIKSVENLIASDNEANDYANKLKRANLEINSYYETNEFKELRTDVSAFVNDLKSEKESSSLVDSIKNFFTPQSISGYALTASVVYFVMLPVNETVIDSTFFAEDFSSFGNETNNYYYEKYKGADDLGDLNKDYIVETINKMIESKTINSVMNYGDDSYFIKVEDLTIDKESIFCLEGYILNAGIKTTFLYCKSEQDETITYLN